MYFLLQINIYELFIHMYMHYLLYPSITVSISNSQANHVYLFYYNKQSLKLIELLIFLMFPHISDLGLGWICI
jgi:hypothetical protein